MRIHAIKISNAIITCFLSIVAILNCESKFKKNCESESKFTILAILWLNLINYIIERHLLSIL